MRCGLLYVGELCQRLNQLKRGNFQTMGLAPVSKSQPRVRLYLKVLEVANRGLTFLDWKHSLMPIR